jgi:hypothetical protein
VSAPIKIEAFVADPSIVPAITIGEMMATRARVEGSLGRPYYIDRPDIVAKYQPHDKAKLMQALADMKRLPWTYKAGYFDCSEASALAEWYLETAGFSSVMVIGRDPAAKRTSSTHAWVVVLVTHPTLEAVPVEATTLSIPRKGIKNEYAGGGTMDYEDYITQGWVVQDIYQAEAWYPGEFDWWNSYPLKIEEILRKLATPTPTPPIPAPTPITPAPTPIPTTPIVRSIKIAPTSGAMGSTVSFSGAGFAPVSPIAVFLDTLATPLLETSPIYLTSSGAGLVSGMVKIPSDGLTAGPHQIIVRDGTGNTASATFFIVLPTPIVQERTALLVNARQTKALFLMLKVDDKVEGSIRVASNDINFDIRDRFGNVILHAARVTNRRFAFIAATSGGYSLVFDNTFSSYRNKIVFVDVQHPAPSYFPYFAGDYIAVGAGEVYDFPIQMTTNKKVEGSFTIEGGNNDIRFSVADPYGNVIVPSAVVYRQRDFAFIAATSGVYKLRFDNSYSSFTSKLLSLKYSVASKVG